MSLTEYHERQGLVEELRESSEDSLARLGSGRVSCGSRGTGRIRRS